MAAAALRPLRPGLGLTLAAMGAALLPTAPAKLAAVAIGLALASADGSVREREMRAILFGLFSLAFLITPYWKTPASPLAQTAAVGALLLIGFLWSWAGAGEVRWTADEEGKTTLWLAALLAAVWAIDLPGLGAPLPFKGDENFHDFSARMLRLLFFRLPPALALTIAAACLWGAWLVERKNFRWRRFAQLALACGALAPLLLLMPNVWSEPNLGLIRRQMLRYPFFTYWPRALAFFDKAQCFDAGINRLIPASAHLALGMAAFFAIGRKVSAPVRFAFALAVATGPSIVNYATINYLDFPLIGVALLLGLQADETLRLSAEELRGRLAGLALIGAGLVKETAVPLLATVGVLWAAVQTARLLADPARRTNLRAFALLGFDLARTAFALSAPLAVYLWFRSFEKTRGFAPNLQVIQQTPHYAATMFRAAWEQYSLVGLLGAASIPFLLIRRKFLFVGANAVLALTLLAFFNLDMPATVGYARFNLIGYAPFAALTGRAVFELHSLAKGRVSRIALTAVLLGVAAFQWGRGPVAIDGSRPGNWGCYHSDTAEYYYPFDQLVRWLREKQIPPQPLAIIGQAFGYDYGFYLNEYGWPGRQELARENRRFNDFQSERRNLEDCLARARGGPGNLFLFFKQTGRFDPQTDSAPQGYRLLRDFTNRHQSLVLYAKQPNPR